MKLRAFFILVIVGVLHQSLFSQVLIDGTSVWNYYTTNLDGTPRPTSYSYYRTILVDGDTVIQSQNYYKRYIQGVDSVWNNMTSTVTVTARPKTFLDYLRADADHFYSYINGMDSMVFDFTKGVGDTVVAFSNSSCRGAITSFDTLYLGSTLVRQANLDFEGVHDYINGIGTIRGHMPESFANCIFIGMPWYRLTCYRRQNETLVLEPGIPCIIFSSVRDVEDAPTAFELFPNPTTGELTLERPLPTTATLDIYTLQGQVVRSMIVRQATTTLDVSELPQGIYFVRCIANGASTVRRFVKQ